MNLWDMLVVTPLSNLLLLLYGLVHNYGVAIVLFSLTAKILLLYFSARGKQGMMRQQRLAPKQKELERIHGKDKAKYNEALMQLYQTEGVSPMSGCLWTMLPMPIFFAMFYVVRAPLTKMMKLTAEEFENLKTLLTNSGFLAQGALDRDFYVEMKIGEIVQTNFDALRSGFAELGILDKLSSLNFDLFPGFSLAPIPNLPWDGGWNWLILLPVLSCLTAYLSSFVSQKINGTGAQTQGNMKVMMMLMPLFSLWIGFRAPVALSVYWIANNLFTMAQDYLLTGHYTKKFDAEDARKAELAERRRAAEEQLREEERLRRLEQGDEAIKHTSKKKQYRLKHAPKPKEQTPGE